MTSNVWHVIILNMKGGVKYMANNARFTFRLPVELLNLIKAEADKKGVSVNAQILHILWEYLEKQENKKGE